MISTSAIKKAVAAATGKEALSVRPFTTGHINTMYLVKTKREELLLRLFSQPWKARKEAFVYGKIRRSTSLPVPKLYAVDDSMKLLPRAYTLMSRLEGERITAAYTKTGDAGLFRKAGEALAELHTITFPKYGWIMETGIRPAFSTWKDFALYDFAYKLGRLRGIPQIRELRPRIERRLEEQCHLLDVKSRPCLLHKDFYPPHILVKDGEIRGIIDVEWATAGHSENDFTKLEQWVFPSLPETRNAFFQGYRRKGKISRDYGKRKGLYQLWHCISMVNISKEVGNAARLRTNLAALKRCV